MCYLKAVRIRHFGFLANRDRHQKISLWRTLLRGTLPTKPQVSNPRADSLAPEWGNQSLSKKGQPQGSWKCSRASSFASAFLPE
jgi:hypothetical protein